MLSRFRHTWTRSLSTLTTTTTASNQPPTLAPHTEIVVDEQDRKVFRVTLVRSFIGLPFKLRRVVRSLGIRHRMQTVYKPQEPGVVGALVKVKELIKVEMVDKSVMLAAKAPPKGQETGYRVIGNKLTTLSNQYIPAQTCQFVLEQCLLLHKSGGGGVD